MQALLIILAVIVGLALFMGYLIAKGAVKLARAAKPALKKEIEKLATTLSHPVIGDDARDQLKRASELADQIPEPGFFNLKETFKALAEATQAMMQAAEKGHDYRRNHTLGVIGEAERHIDIVIESIRKEFSREVDLAVAKSLVADANKLLQDRKYDEAEAKSKLASDAANAEYSRVRGSAKPGPDAPPSA